MIQTLGFDDEQTTELLRQLAGLRSDCGRLEPTLGKLNFFRAVGATRAELRHSDFLAFLLNPSEAHGLGDAFLKAWLRECLKINAPACVARAVAELEKLLSSQELSETEIRREWQSIDILILNEARNFGVIVENKTISYLHGDQLERYWQRFQEEYPQLTNAIGLYLRPRREGEEVDQHYVSVTYATVQKAARDVLTAQGLRLDDDMRMMLTHYADLVEGEFVKDSEAHAQAWNIHRDFPKAVDFIQRNRRSDQMREFVKELIQEESREKLSIPDSGAYWIGFIPKEWEQIPLVQHPKTKLPVGWLFWFDDFSSVLKVYLGANKEMKHAEEELLKLAALHPDLFLKQGRNDGWKTVWECEIINGRDLARIERKDAFERVARWWTDFIRETFPKLRDACAQQLHANKQ